jgi:hypothetical protein
MAWWSPRQWPPPFVRGWQQVAAEQSAIYRRVVTAQRATS